MEYKMIVSDLDGTLLNSENKISLENKETLKKLIKGGKKFVIATGRHHIDAQFFAKELENDFYLITNNGAKILYKSKEVFKSIIPRNLLQKLLELNIDTKVSKNLFTENDWYSDKEIEIFNTHNTNGHFPLKITNLENYKEEEVLKFFFLSTVPEKIKKVEKLLSLDLELKQGLNFSTSDKFCLEVTAKNINKGQGIKRISELEMINLNEVIAFGDGLNDKEMLEIVGNGIIMENGNPILKEQLSTKKITKSCDENGVAYYLKKIFKEYFK